MYLINIRSGSIKISDEVWRYMLKLAKQYGWSPLGTIPNKDYLKNRAKNPEGGYEEDVIEQEISNWNGDYVKSEHQIITWADALNMSYALEEALQSNLKNKENVKELIEFCKKGSFFLG